MKNGDAYKIRNLAAHGMGIDELCKKFRAYSKEEIERFLPKKKVTKKKAVKKTEPETEEVKVEEDDGNGSIDMQPSP